MRCTGLHVRPNSEAMNPEARCRAGRPCLEGSESRNRLSGTPTRPVFFVSGVPEGSERRRHLASHRGHHESRNSLVAVPAPERGACPRLQGRPPSPTDRKSTRLNSSHLVISYAVFCLKKKTT